MIVAMDGPAGTGKGTICKLVAERLDFTYIDTGAMYRCITLKMLDNDIKLEDTDKIIDMFQNTIISFKNEKNDEGKLVQRVFLDGVDVSEEIRTPRINETCSPYSALPLIREKLVDLQRKLAVGNNVIMEGRDITTVVFPNAELKIYLDATPEERANRRYKELISKGIETTYEETLESLNKRDYNDMHKEVGALKIAEDAVVVDTTNLGIEEVYEVIKNLIIDKMR
ncbi:MAG: (d)CMP kinase [Clostridia bacterium]|nr:(d)CMP kinase [Clostridia bacterium]